jgi:hypothetical protein
MVGRHRQRRRGDTSPRPATRSSTQYPADADSNDPHDTPKSTICPTNRPSKRIVNGSIRPALASRL